MKKIEVFKTWCWRRALKIYWTDRMLNEEVYRKIQERRSKNCAFGSGYTELYTKRTRNK